LIGGSGQPSIRKQCELLNLARGSYYYEPCGESSENLVVMRRLDELHLEYPVYGSRRLKVLLEREGFVVNRKRVQRCMQLMGLSAIYPRRSLSQPGEGHEIFPYLLRDLEILGPNHVWCMDITYVPMAQGFLYLVAVMDWWSRFVLAWEISNTMDAEFCIRAWEQALEKSPNPPVISNTDQGAQFTCSEFIEAVQTVDTQVSMDGRGRWIDNRFIERLWRSVKYEDIYLNDYSCGLDLRRGLTDWFGTYNTVRPHTSLDGATPQDWYQRPEDFGGMHVSQDLLRRLQAEPRGLREAVTNWSTPAMNVEF
jgi:putative transposase